MMITKICLAAFLAISISVGLAQAETIHGSNYDDTFIGFDDKGNQIRQWISSPERIYDSNEFKNYILNENSNQVKLETQSSGSLIFNKNTCAYDIYPSGKITPQSISQINDISWTVKGKVSSSTNWSPLNTINSATCTGVVDSTPTTVQITGQRQTSQGTFQIVLDYTFGGKIKETMRAYNNNVLWNNHNIGFTEKFQVPRIINLGETQYDLSQYNGTVLGRNWIENNQAKLIKLTDKLSYDFGLGFENLNDVKITWDGTKAYLSLNYLYTSQIIPYQTWFTVDPTFNSLTSNQERVYSSGSGSNCAALTGTNTDSNFQNSYSSGATGCQIVWQEWNISVIPASSTVGSAYFEWDQTATNGWSKDCGLYAYATQPSTLSTANKYSQGWSGVGSGTSSLCTTNGNDKQLTLNSTGVANLQANISGAEGWWGAMFQGVSPAAEGGTHEFTMTASQTRLNIIYSLPSVLQLRSMNFDNSTQVPGGTIYRFNTTNIASPETKTINSTGWVKFDKTFFGNGSTSPQNYTTKDLDSFVISNFWNYTTVGNTVLQNRTLVYDVNCDGDGDQDWRIKTNDTAYHRMPVYPTTPTCATNDDITFKAFWSKSGRGPLTNQTTILNMTSINTADFDWQPSRVLVNGSSKTMTWDDTKKVLTVTGIQVGNGKGSFALNFNIRTDNVTNQPTNLSVTPLSGSQLSLSWTAPNATHGDAIQSYQIWRNGTMFLNSTGSTATTYVNSGLSSGHLQTYKICAWNRIGCSPLSSSASGITHATTSGTVSLVGGNVGDVENINATISISNGSPTPFTVQDVILYRNNNIVYTNTTDFTIPALNTPIKSRIWYQMLTDDVNIFHVKMTVSNTTGTVTIGSANNVTVTREYAPSYFTAEDPDLGDVNYTASRSDDGTLAYLKVNRDKGGNTFPVSCLYQTLFQALANDGEGTWYNVTASGWYNATVTVDAIPTIYITCINPPNILFTTTLYSEENPLAAGIALFDAFGGILGAPSIMLIVLAIFSLATGKNSPQVLVLALIVIAILSSIGLLVFEANIFPMILVAGAVGIFSLKRYYF